MAHQKIVKEINNKLSEITEQFKKISSSDEIHLIELDILLGMMREIYVKTYLLKEPASEEEIAGTPIPAQYAQPIPAEQPSSQESLPETTEPSIPDLPETDTSSGVQPESETSDKPASPEYTAVLPETRPEEEDLQPEIPNPAMEIPLPHQKVAQAQPEFVQPQPGMIKQEIEMVQPETEPYPHYTKTAQPDEPEPIQSPTSTMQSYYAPKPPVHQPELFGNGNLSEKYKTEAPSINDRMTVGKSDHTLADKINLTPISDIKSAIGINEKFQFINELFEGSAQLYNEAIALLNNCTGAEAARTLFHDYQIRNNWDTENKAFLQFREYVERRYLHS
jgi:hypothetical protein